MAEQACDLSQIRHSASHVMAQAVKDLFPDVKLAIGPATADGFYYDFEKATPFTPDDLGAIEKRMHEIVKAKTPLIREEMPRAEARKFFEDLGEKYKVEIIDGIEDDTVSIYRQGDYVDLCRGPHVEHTGKIGAFKLLSVAGAYWRGDETRPMLQRIYGTSFFNKEDLKAYMTMREEAERRDHRKLGRELDLFSFNETLGPGLVLWHPKGALVRSIIEQFWKKEHLKRDYDLVYTPHIGKIDLWNTSGHTGFYRENMFSPMVVDEQEYLLKPMNCPGHVLIYQSKVRSYRDLPVRLAELGTVYRYERSGVLHGLLRVRSITIDDAHIFCAPEQVKSEISQVIDFAEFMLKKFGFLEYKILLATKPKKYVGTDEGWEMATNALVDVMNERGINFDEDPGGAAFYGPKIDIKLKDSLGRLWQGPTIQFDFNLPERFNVTYVGADGEPHLVYMVHRALFGSLERFFGCLIEHYAGAFPLWLAPVQAVLLPIADRHHEYARKIADELQAKDYRVTVDDRNEKTGFKIREAQVQKIPYMLVVGDREMENGTVAVRRRDGTDLGAISLNDFEAEMQKELTK